MVYYRDVTRPFPALSEKVIIVTGSSSRIGLEAARIFVKEGGAHVIMACRNLRKAKPFEDELNASGPGHATLLRLDTSDFESVRSFVQSFNALSLGRLDVLLLNAGIMWGPRESVETESTEYPQVDKQLATNHLGHFLLTNLLLSNLTGTPGARIIPVSSLAARLSKPIDYETMTLQDGTSYDTGQVYAQTKLANLLFVRELQRRLKASGVDTLAIPSHPGYARTNLVHRATGILGLVDSLMKPFLSHDGVGGSHPLVLAAIIPDPKVDTCYCAPSRMNEMRGMAFDMGQYPDTATPEAAKKLWEMSEKLVGMKSSI